MTENQPLVSIITPSFNQGEFLEHNIISILNQNYRNLEHIIVDGGSTDNTLNIINKYSNKYNLTFISEPDEGQSDAINKGFALARGDIVGWLNSDDTYIYTNTLSTIVTEFLCNGSVDIIYGNRIVIDGKNCIKRVYISPSWNYDYLLTGSCYISQPATFFRSNIIKKYTLDKSLSFSMDLEFWLRLGRKYTFHHLNRFVAGDRIHGSAKRMRKEYSKAYRAESKKMRLKHGAKFNKYHLLRHYLICIRLMYAAKIMGLAELPKLNLYEFAFDAKLISKKKLILHQIISIDY